MGHPEACITALFNLCKSRRVESEALAEGLVELGIRMIAKVLSIITDVSWRLAFAHPHSPLDLGS